MAIVPSIIRFEPGGGKGPGILFANRESRAESRKKYQLCIHMDSSRYRDPLHKAPFGVFINGEVDILHITPMVYKDKSIDTGIDNEPGYLNHMATLRARSEYSRWLLPVQTVVFDVDDFRNPQGGTEYYSYSCLFNLSEMCPKLKKIIFVPKGSYELRYHEIVPNGTLSEVEQSCIDTFQEHLKQFLIDLGMNELTRKWKKCGCNCSKIDPELVVMKQEIGPLSKRRELPLWELEEGLQE